MFAHKSLKNKVCGLCGTWDGTGELTLRNGSAVPTPDQTAKKAKDRNVTESFGRDWEVI